MILILHILIAITSVGYAAYVFFSPSNSKLRISYGLTALTVASGTYLIVSMQAHMLHACVSGLVYLAAVTFLIVLARNKLASANNQP